MDEYSSIYSQPKTPRLKQGGFPASTGNQQEKALTNENGEENQKIASVEVATSDSHSTPLTVSIPTFENVQTLPTPMTYTPLSPGNLSMSPIDQSSLNIPKRRSHARLLDDMLSAAQPNQRVVSELIAPANLSPQRVVSLPTVTEEASVTDSVESDNCTKEPYLPESDGLTEKHDDDILQGFLLDHWDRPLLWKKVRPIGSGNFSNVLLYELIDQSNSRLKQVAVKRLKYPEELLNVEQINTSLRYKETLSRLENSLTRELQVLKSLNHPCIVKLLGINNPIFVTSKKPLRDFIKKTPRALPPCDMIMSYCPAGDLLAAVMARNGRLEAWLIQRIFAELVLAVKYLHGNSIIHRDLKLENILLKYSFDDINSFRDSPIYHKQNFIELADFGLCKRIENNEMCTARCGSEDYVSPEILMGVPYDGHLSDTWALGVILYSLFEDRLPFDPPPNASARQRSRATSHRIARFDWRWYRLSDDDTNVGKQIVENTLTRKNQRWSINEIYGSPFVKTIVDTLDFS
ncbi:serine/threonine protein kinase PRR1 [Saccharomyces paradoxus]|uniref:Serine/threonine protein kinase PRR1 n=1 Tax=Saccharomyces paradoxus TaxID=27291 RepID=A0A8B8UUX2_SACPA|nr:Prr1 [Saccharomyces paradoxus]QHS74481.1 Prr1 [Saccharomyces paradoxus]